ncbi:hypothetical protein QJQ45_018898 [Haematococcus lacustris]|nr:hypothetical protein QJQ45_018898 [Haematococcus lacustris]
MLSCHDLPGLSEPLEYRLAFLGVVGVHFIKVDSRVLHGVCKQLGLTKEPRAAFTSQPALSHHWARWFNTNKLRNKEFHFERLVDTDGVSVCVHYTRPLPPPQAPPPAASSSSTSSRPSAAAAAAHAVGLPHIGRGIAETREFVFDPDTQIGVGIDPGVTQAVSAASGVWDPATGQLKADQLRQWKLTKGEVKHASGLNNARRDTERWLAPIKPHLQHLAAASSAGTSMEANLKHITVTLATWDAVWEVYLDPKWARQRLRLYGAQDRALEQFFNKVRVQGRLVMESHLSKYKGKENAQACSQLRGAPVKLARLCPFTGMVSFYLLHVGRQPLVHRLCICTCVLPSTNVIGTAVPLHRLWAHSLQCAGLRKPVGVHQAVPRKTRLVSAPAAAGIAKLNGDNWYQWEFDVQNALVLCGLDAAICAPAPAGLGTGGTDQGRSGVEAAATPDPEAVPTAALSASINARAHAFISSTVNAAKYRFVCQSCSTARELWQKLKAMHVSKVLASSSVLIQQMSMIRMQPGQPVQEYWQHAQELDQQIAACSAPDKPFHNSFSLAVLGLSADFDSVANQLLAEESTLTFDKALPRLLVQERVLISRRQAAGLALSARPGGSRDRSSNRGIGAGSDGGGGSRSGGDRGKGHGRRSKADSECYNCGQFGHYAYECPRASVSSDRRDSPSHSPHADRSRGDRPTTPGPRGRDSGLPDSRTRRSPSPLRHRSSLAFSGHSGADAALAVAPNLLKGQWLVDSGCSTHLTPHIELLRDYQPLRAPHHIVCGNGSTMTAAGQGSVVFEGAGGSMVLRNVLHVPDAEGSLLSVGKAARAGGEVVFTGQGCSIHMPGADHSIKARMVVGDLFLLNSKPVPLGDSSVSMSARSCDDPRLMHFRLGHPGYRQLARAVREDMLLGTSVRAAQCEAIADSGGVCEPCVLGKQHRFVAVQHPGLGLPVKRPLALVHSDVCGPFDCPTPSGNLYFVTVLDEYSGLVAVELIRQKSAAAQAIIVCLTELQRQSGHTVKALRTDRGGEFTGGELQAWLRAEGVIHQQTAPYSPEMNGSAERINRTLEECVRAMTQAAGTPKHLWGEALRTAADLHNLSAVSGKPCTPHELMFGVKPDVSHLRVWGCPAYVHDPMPASKLDSRSVKGVFVGYERGGKAYRVWAGGRIYVSKSVVFDEQTVLQRFVPHAVLAPAELAAPPLGDASRGGVGSGGAVSSNSGSEGSRGGAPAVTPFTHVSSNSGSEGSRGRAPAVTPIAHVSSSSGSGGQAGSVGDPLAAPGSLGGVGGSLSEAGVAGLGGDGAGGMERTPESLAVPLHRKGPRPLHLETGVSRRALSKCRQFFVSEQCVLPNPHRPGNISTVGREFQIVSTYMRRKILDATQNSVAKRARAARLACGEIA